MLQVLLRRFSQFVPLVLGVIVLNFGLIQLAPGSFLDVMTAEQQISDPVLIERLRVTYGMDQPAIVQLFKYIVSVAKLDFGFSYRQNAPVFTVIMQALPATVILMLAAIGIAVVVGMSAGIAASVKVNTIWDNIISALAVFFFAAPTFWLGIMLTILFSVRLGWFPVGGIRTIGQDSELLVDVLDVAKHLVLPAVTLGLFYAATYARVMRASMLEVLKLDFIRTAKAKGLTPRRLIVGHAIRNAMLPVVTLLGLQLGTVLGGSVVVEAVFSWPGIGSLMLDSVMSRNFPVVLGVLVLSSVVVLAANAAVDVIAMKLDPRIKAR